MIGVIVDVIKAREVFDDVIELEIGVLEQDNGLVESLDWKQGD
ncbi:MAG: hypothetical protein ACP5MD_13395 [Verrucomicrobiia bacterium]